jgi:hypothetical protein
MPLSVACGRLIGKSSDKAYNTINSKYGANDIDWLRSELILVQRDMKSNQN